MVFTYMTESEVALKSYIDKIKEAYVVNGQPNPREAKRMISTLKDTHFFNKEPGSKPSS